MKTRSRFLALAALLFLSWDASAQARATVRRPAQAGVEKKLGSFERTRLLTKLKGARGGAALMRLGSVDRRSLLTTGKSIYPKKPKRIWRARR
jgi:hypothetical protein